MSYATTGRLGRLSYIKESAFGTYLTPTAALSITKEDLKLKIDNEVDPRLIAKLVDPDLIQVGKMIDGGMDVTVHPQEIGPLLNFALMKNAAPTTAPDAYLIISYVGTDAYSSVSLVGTTLTGKSGATQGAAAQAWTMDISNVLYNTPALMGAYITAVAGSKWFGYVCGNTASPYTEMTTFAETALSGNMLVCTFLSATTSKSHYITPAGAADAETSFSACVDRVFGTGQAISLAGCKINSLQLAIASKKILTAALKVMGKVEATGATYPAVTATTDTPYVAGNVRAWLGGLEISTIKDLSINLNNNLSNDGLVGSFYIQEPIRQGLGIEVSASVNMVQSQWTTFYPLFTAGTALELMIYAENVAYVDATLKVKHSVLIRIPVVKFKTYETVLSGPNRITTSFTGQGLSQGTYPEISAYVVDAAASAY